MGIVVNFSLLQ